MSTFADTGLNEDLLKAIEELGFETPTPIQIKTIPLLLESDQDVVALSQTGTGKTAAFGLPALQRTDIENKKTQTIVLCPTRELCLQITRDLKSYAKYTKNMEIVPVYGGASIDTQIKQLKKRAQIVVATPGRATDLIRRKKLILGDVKRVILDEADEMLTMGFKEELDAILEQTPKEKQTILFSATMGKEVERISKTYMDDPIRQTVAKVNIGAENVEHHFYMVSGRDKYEALKRIADINPNIYGIVFCRTRRETKEIAKQLMDDGYGADALHGDLSQAQRDEVMARFRARQLTILVATDVAARGLDVNDLTHVINFNLPDVAEIYTHRSGRTGRAGKSGISIAIIHSRGMRKLSIIERSANIRFIKKSVPTGADICSKQLLSVIDKIRNVEVNESQIEPFLASIYEKLEGLDRETLIKHFVSTEFNRFLTYYKNSRDINYNGSSRRDDRSDRRDDRRDRNDRRDRRDRGDRRDRRDDRRDRDAKESKRRDNRSSNADLTRLYINVGTKNDLNPGRLIGLINNGLDSGDAVIGKIEILKKFSFFEIDTKVSKPLIDSLNNKKFEGVDLMVEVSQSVYRAEGEEKKMKKKKSGPMKESRKKRSKDKKERRKRN